MPAETKPSLWISCRQGRDDYSTVITLTVTRGRSFLPLRVENGFKKEDSLQSTGITAHSRFTYMAHRLISLSRERLNFTSITNQNSESQIKDCNTRGNVVSICKILLFNVFSSSINEALQQALLRSQRSVASCLSSNLPAHEPT